MKFKKVVSVILALVLALPLVFWNSFNTRAAVGKTLNDCTIGLTLHIKEDGEFKDYILINHNYLGTGNQLLMRKDTVQHTEPSNWGNMRTYWYSSAYYYEDDRERDHYVISNHQLGTYKYDTSSTRDWLENDFYVTLEKEIRDKIIPVTIPWLCSYTAVLDRDYDYVSGGHYDGSGKGVSGTVTKIDIENSKVFILSGRELTGKANSISEDFVSSGNLIPYFTTNDRRASDRPYTLRDGKSFYTYNWEKSIPSLKGSISTVEADGTLSNTNQPYYRPCFVLPSDTPVTAKNNIVADHEPPVISSVTVPENWVTIATATINATDNLELAEYAVTKTNIEPTDGWKSSNTFTIKENGEHFAWAKDGAGNTTVKAFTAKVDNKNPTIESVSIPNEWAKETTVGINAADDLSGVWQYSISSTPFAPGTGWQSESSFTVNKNGTYYVFVRDFAGNTSVAKSFSVSKIDDIKPVVTAVNVPNIWSKDSTVTITATDNETGLKDYAISKTNTPPADGWQDSATFTVTQNGTYYSFCRDKVLNVSVGFKFTVTKIDDIKPVVTAVNVPEIWNKDSTVTVNAKDNETGLKDFAISKTNTPPADGWQDSATFTLTENGTYYSFCRDKVSNVSVGFKFTVTKIDNIKPTVSGVNMSDKWGTETTITLIANDNETGLKDFAVSQSLTTPTEGWQERREFKITANGTYYAFARDNVLNESVGFRFTVTKIDDKKPTVSYVSVSSMWDKENTASITAYDTGTGIKEYAVAKENKAPIDGWQTSNTFTFTENESFFAFARDNVGLVSDGKPFAITKIDKIPPIIENLSFGNDNKTLTVTAKDNESGIGKITVDGVSKTGGYCSFNIPEGTRYIKILAEDKAENKSQEQTVRVPGWYNELSTLTILPVEFSERNQVATIRAKTTDTAVKFINVNGNPLAQNPTVYRIGANERYLEIYAEDINGDRSPKYRVRIPGWSEELESIAITECIFSDDNTKATITATETAGAGILGIYSNGEFLEGNPVTYDIPKGTRHLKLQAENKDGDRSKVLTRRVPGWSETVTSINISNVEFMNYNTKAEITAIARNGSEVAGIYVNGEYFKSNPCVYKIPKSTDILYIYAVNTEGDCSPTMDKAVPRDMSKSYLKLTITPPEWTSAQRAKVLIKATDKDDIAVLTAKTAEDDEWSEILDKGYIYIENDTTVYAEAENMQGDVKSADLNIKCFDRIPPEISTTQDGEYMNIRATDDKSGVKAILVNNKEYKEPTMYDGKLSYKIPPNTTEVIIQALDFAGNSSDIVKVGVKITVTAVPNIVRDVTPPTQPTPPTPPKTDNPEPPKAEPKEEPEEEPAVPARTEETTDKKINPVAAGAAAAGTAATGLGSLVWWYLRKKKREEFIPEIDLDGKNIRYDESEFGGAVPKDKNVLKVDFGKGKKKHSIIKFLKGLKKNA